MTIRFDADENRVVEGAHPVDAADREGWAGDDETAWYLTDPHSNGRWLFVDRPTISDGVTLGVVDSPGRGNGTASGFIYRKHLSAAACRSLADALRQAADEQDALDAQVKAARDAQAERVRACAEDGGHQWGLPPIETTHATAAWTAGSDTISEYEVCTRCGLGEWHSRPWNPVAEARQRIAEATARQVALAKDGRAEGQCPSCGSYTADGQPPVLHLPGCERFPEGHDLDAGLVKR